MKTSNWANKFRSLSKTWIIRNPIPGKSKNFQLLTIRLSFSKGTQRAEIKKDKNFLITILFKGPLISLKRKRLFRMKFSIGNHLWVKEKILIIYKKTMENMSRTPPKCIEPTLTQILTNNLWGKVKIDHFYLKPIQTSLTNITKKSRRWKY